MNTTDIINTAYPLFQNTTGSLHFKHLQSSVDYFPFGAQLPGRGFSTSSYRFGFNGKEKDDETYGTGNEYDFGARLYDPRLGRWMSIDILEENYPYLSPYNFCANDPVLFVDPNGKEIWIQGPPGTEPVLYVPNQTALQEGMNDYVKAVSSTLDNLVNSGYDKFNIISTLATDCSDVLIKPGRWDEQLACAANGNGKGIGGGEIPWSPQGGVVNNNCSRRSPASLLLHELAEIYYVTYDPLGKMGEENELLENASTAQGKANLNSFIDEQQDECGPYEDYANKWIILEVENIPGEGMRSEHGYDEEFKAEDPFSLEGPTKSEVNEGRSEREKNANSPMY